MSESHDIEIRQLNIQITKNLEVLTKLLVYFKKHEDLPQHCLSEFQQVMDNLLPLKDQADMITLHYDHA